MSFGGCGYWSYETEQMKNNEMSGTIAVNWPGEQSTHEEKQGGSLEDCLVPLAHQQATNQRALQLSLMSCLLILGTSQGTKCFMLRF